MYNRYVKLQAKVSTNREHIKFFSSRSYNISANKTEALFRSLSERDAKLFPFNPKELNGKQYLPVYCGGIRRFEEEMRVHQVIC
ncbi:Fatty-acyl-CoA reductase [Operophtera brumata]|uniref:Fatty-acyl-CoA reductase n=1 Tax=Operophtera brumata TaxID=104452 RepID=A0A0L7LG95_OPEBR|nr:Fatty-acyl-CoA reductase [Operophtera brumata]